MHPSPNQITGGERPVTGEEVLFGVGFNPGIVLPVDRIRPRNHTLPAGSKTVVLWHSRQIICAQGFFEPFLHFSDWRILLIDRLRRRSRIIISDPLEPDCRLDTMECVSSIPITL
jgi:hypothetical protein